SPFEFPSYSYSDSPFFCPEGEPPLLYKPLGHRAEAPPHGQVTPTLPEESWGQVYTFVLPVPKGFPFYISLWDPARRPPRTVKSPLLSLRRVGARCTLFFPPEGESWGRVYTFFFPEGESWGQVYTFLFPKERVGAKCTLGFFPKVFPKGNPMVHGEVGSRRPDVHTWRHRPHGGSTPVGANACGSLAVLQQAALRFALHHRIPLRISLLLIIGFPFYISLWDSARRPLRTVKSPQLSLRRVGAKCILSFFPTRRAPPFYISLWDPARRPPAPSSRLF